MIKQSDVALLILVASISLLASYFVGNALINSPDNRQADIETVVAISPDFPIPDTSIFNGDAINPTQLIQIGQGNSDQPFEN